MGGSLGKEGLEPASTHDPLWMANPMGNPTTGIDVDYQKLVEVVKKLDKNGDGKILV